MECARLPHLAGGRIPFESEFYSLTLIPAERCNNIGFQLLNDKTQQDASPNL